MLASFTKGLMNQNGYKNNWSQPDIIKLPSARVEGAEVGSEEVLLSPNTHLSHVVCLVGSPGDQF